MEKLILASGSPRRSAMLRELGVAFSVVQSSFEEPPHDGVQPPQDYVQANARGKALQVAGGGAEGIVIGSDTVVVLGAQVLGKPASMEEAARYLHQLNGVTHAVYSGLCIIETGGGRELAGVEKTQVTFRKLTEREIALYLARIDPLDKAGAYAIQDEGAIVVEGIAGCYYNVVGFPIARLESMLLRLGCSLFDFMTDNPD